MTSIGGQCKQSHDADEISATRMPMHKRSRVSQGTMPFDAQQSRRISVQQCRQCPQKIPHRRCISMHLCIVCGLGPVPAVQSTQTNSLHFNHSSLNLNLNFIQKLR
mmetsp:Transcript_29158/g.67011  ORF Transcript_29158/g.67011 Transcript_29158/m.67011 type:complete len:106 (+) Transcript_29158:510-827(+)